MDKTTIIRSTNNSMVLLFYINLNNYLGLHMQIYSMYLCIYLLSADYHRDRCAFSKQLFKDICQVEGTFYVY